MHQITRSLAAICFASSVTPALAGGDLLVAPTRVVLDGPRGTEVFLNNVGNETATYRITVQLKRMTSAGDLEDVAPEAATAKEQATLAMITYAPRRVTLAPNQPQAIRIGVRPPTELPDGEYRAHILFRAIPDAAAPSAPTAPVKGISISLIPIYGVTIPIIVRKGNLEATAALSNARLVHDLHGSALAFTLTRSGSRSTYGVIRVTRPGIAKPLLEARGIAVYAELDQRTVTLPVSADVAALLPGPAKIEYLADSDAGGGIIASAQVVIR